MKLFNPSLVPCVLIRFPVVGLDWMVKVVTSQEAKRVVFLDVWPGIVTHIKSSPIHTCLVHQVPCSKIQRTLRALPKYAGSSSMTKFRSAAKWAQPLPQGLLGRMAMPRLVLRGCFSRHPRRYLLLVLLVTSALFVWQFNFVHFFDPKNHNFKQLIQFQGVENHHHINSKWTSLSSSLEYIEISDVRLNSINTSIVLLHISKATSQCNQVGNTCRGILETRTGDSVRYILLSSLPTLEKGPDTLHLKSTFASDVVYRESTCAIHARLSDSQRSPGCKLPNLDPFDPMVKQFMSPMEPMFCPGEMYTSYHDCVLKARKKEAVRRIVYRAIRRPEASDSGFETGPEKTLPLDGNGVKLDEDFIQVETQLKSGGTQTDLHAHVSPKPEVLSRPKKDAGIPLNIIILGMDGNSNANVQRLLPDTYKFLQDELKAFIFKGFSLLGEATTPQLTGLLTGKTVEENCAKHEARKGVTFDGTVDPWPFVFKDLKQHGYVTMFSEDAPTIGAFNLRLNGFTNQPTDHYGHYFWWAAPMDAELGVHSNCINAQAQHVIQLQYLRSLITAYPNTPKFGFTFLGSLCHQHLNMVSSGARDIHQFLKSLHSDGLLNNTLLIVMGDHGARFDSIRATLQGKQEERLPFLSMAFPDWFRVKYPKFSSNLAENTQRIISPLDVHATFMHILKYPHNPSKSDLTRGTSLFEHIPESRECIHAGIPDHFCPCVIWKPVPTAHPHVQLGAHLTLHQINKLLTQRNEVKSLCHGLELDQILNAVQELPNKKMVLFNGIKDGAGLGVGTPMFIDDSEEQQSKCNYQIQLRVRPSMALFESSVRLENGRLTLDSDISRVNRYGTQSDCVKQSHPFLRKFCLCRH